MGTTDPQPERGTAGADSPPGGGRGRSGVLGLLALVAFVALLLWLMTALVGDNSAPVPS